MIDVRDVLGRLHGVTGGNGQWAARCPAHDDKNASLSVHVGEKGIVLFCHAGCDASAVAAALGYNMSDLFFDARQGAAGSQRSGGNAAEAQRGRAYRCPADRREVAVYQYDNGAQKVRYEPKDFRWRRPDGCGGWLMGRGDLPHVLYKGGGRSMGPGVLVVEGEKDADTAARLGWSAVSPEDGASKSGSRSKWREEYTAELEGREAFIIPDNDDTGKAHAEAVASALYGKAAAVYVLDWVTLWPACPAHGDLSDMAAALGDDAAAEALNKAAAEAVPMAAPADPTLAIMTPVSVVEEKDVEYLVKPWLPRGGVVLLASDGGVGKTTVCCNLLAALSAGKASVLDADGVPVEREPAKVLYMTTEDSIAAVIKPKLRKAGADLERVIAINMSAAAGRPDVLNSLKFTTPEMLHVLRALRPVLAVFDPLQAFIPDNVNMGYRNQMRNALAPLAAAAEELNMCVLIVMHTNKRDTVGGRSRISDSADVFDYARGAMMMGWTQQQGVRYISHEKNSYGGFARTVLLSINDDGQTVKTGSTWKRDADFRAEGRDARNGGPDKPKQQDCESYIVAMLARAGGVMDSGELKAGAIGEGYTMRTYDRARAALKKRGHIGDFSSGFKDKRHYTKLHINKAAAGGETLAEMPEVPDDAGPFDGPELEQMTMEEGSADNE